jgi:thymidylate kinase
VIGRRFGAIMATAALIGPDGTGKTTIARRLADGALPVPARYLYMGLSIESSNVALPTSRIFHRLEVARVRRSLQAAGETVPADISLSGLEHRYDRRGRIGAVARLIHRLSEETYRQLVSWYLQVRGYIVIYDRHFLFDVHPGPDATGTTHRLSERINNWYLAHLYPRPDLVVLLDAPAGLLLDRKQEVPLEYLENNRATLASKRGFARDWVEVDAARPLDDVVHEVSSVIMSRLTGTASNGTTAVRARRLRRRRS